MRLIIDRFEGKIAIVELENGEIINIPREILPSNTQEGDIVSLKIEKEETRRRQERIRNKFRKLIVENKEDKRK